MAPVLALLAFPSAFLLVSVYAESLFLATSLAAFVLARRGRPGMAAAAAFAAGLTRIHGLALIPALALLGWSRWRAGQRAPAAFAPAAGVILAYAGLAAYFASVTGDPLRYLGAKREGFDTKFGLPWETLAMSVTRLDWQLARGGLGAVLVGLELPCLWLLLIVIYLLAERCHWPEAVFVACGAALSLCAGSLWGLPRFVLSLFPVFTALAALLHRCPALWPALLLCGGFLQAALLIHYVTFLPPAP